VTIRHKYINRIFTEQVYNTQYNAINTVTEQQSIWLKQKSDVD